MYYNILFQVVRIEGIQYLHIYPMIIMIIKKAVILKLLIFWFTLPSKPYLVDPMWRDPCGLARPLPGESDPRLASIICKKSQGLFTFRLQYAGGASDTSTLGCLHNGGFLLISRLTPSSKLENRALLWLLGTVQFT